MNLKTYDYCNVKNEVSYRICITTQNQFFMQHKDKTGKWVNGINGIQKVLYNLPELINRPDEVVFLCQSEDDADLLMKNDFLATAHSNGYDAWREEYVEYLKNRYVILLQHDNPSGSRHAFRAVNSLAGKVKGIPFVIVLSKPTGKGAVQHMIDEKHSLEIFHQIIKRFMKNCAKRKSA